MPDRKPKPDRITPHKDKLCKTCRHPIHWTPQQARDWDIIKYCSDACRGTRIRQCSVFALEAAILELSPNAAPTKPSTPPKPQNE